ncbi:MAG TPA: nucleoside deaminase [Flavitalea sp.]|nr:nucleoside deaminase [Flavitalea sp.]
MQITENEFFMQHCLQLAADAKRKGKTAVGSVVVKDNLIIAEGTEGDSSLPQLLAHAEIVAILKALQKIGTNDLYNCELYTTVEPCYMCSYVIRETNIARVIFGTRAGEIGGAFASYPLLTTKAVSRWQTEILLDGGVLEEDCLQLLKK